MMAKLMIFTALQMMISSCGGDVDSIGMFEAYLFIELYRSISFIERTSISCPV